VTRESTPSSGPRPFNAAALRVGAVAAGFVVLVTLLFGGLGAWQDRDVSASTSAEPAPAPVSPPPPAPAPAPDPADADGDADDLDDADGDDGGDAEEEPAAPAPPAEPAARPNSEVSVQVLDGITGGGTAAVNAAVATLREAGFTIAAQNAGRAYDVTTVFYSDGFEAEGRRVGAALGVTTVRAMAELPAERRLSSSVNVHVIIGADRR
jgi:hypothetical protein